MSEEALWSELKRVAEDWLDAETKPGFRESYARVARTLSICHRIGIEHPGVDLLGRDDFTEAELNEFFRKSWRLATLHEEQRRVNVVESRKGVDRDAGDFQRLRATLAEARLMILDFGWLPEEAKRRHLAQLETLSTELQRSRDEFDVALAGVDDPERARLIEVGRPGWGDTIRRLLLGGSPRPNGAARALPPPDPREEA